MTIKSRIEKLEKNAPEEEQKLFYSTSYKNKAEFDKAVQVYKATKPKNKPIVIIHNGSYEDEKTGETIKYTMYKKNEEVEDEKQR